jgi:hypothetical protein
VLLFLGSLTESGANRCDAGGEPGGRSEVRDMFTAESLAKQETGSPFSGGRLIP